MSEDATALFRALQLSDSFLPIGSYTMSYGLESFVQHDHVKNVRDLRVVVEDYLRGQIGPCDMVAISAVYRADQTLEDVREVDNQYHARQLLAEAREGSIKSGTRLLELFSDDRALLKTCQEAVKSGDAYGHYPIVLGLVSKQSGVSRRDACIVHAYSFVVGLLGAAQRLLGLSHRRLQSLLDDISGMVAETWEQNADREVFEMTNFAPMADIMSMEHERADLRLFRS